MSKIISMIVWGAVIAITWLMLIIFSPRIAKEIKDGKIKKDDDILWI